MRVAVLLVLPLVLFVPTTCSLDNDNDSSVGPSLEVGVSESNRRACTVDDLMPPGDVDDGDHDYDDIHGQWLRGDDGVVTPPYDCTCSTLKARSVCVYGGGGVVC